MAKNGSAAGVVLAAGKGTRMRSERPKVLHELLGEPMLWYVYQALGQALPDEAISTIVGHGSQEVAAAFPRQSERFILQDEQLGTGHALQCAYPGLRGSGFSWALVVNGDAPLLDGQALQHLLDQARELSAEIAFISVDLPDPSGYGRVVRSSAGEVEAVIEDRDLESRPECRGISEINAGIYCFDLEAIEADLGRLSRDNAQAEYYITELIDLCLARGGRVATVRESASEEFLGVNSPRELARCEGLLQRRHAEAALDRGVILHSPELVRLGPRADISPGAELFGPLEIVGDSTVEAGSRVDSHVWIRNGQIGAGSWVRHFSHLEDVQVKERCQVGPYARLRPETVLAEGAKVGNFVEVKKSRLERGAKANHLAYLGDAEVGEGVNIGAGTITCNYDGKKKHKTVIGAGSFVGSNASLVAPLHIGEESLIGAGSTITSDVPEKTLAVARIKQKNLPRKIKG